jgi:predicted permease
MGYNLTLLPIALCLYEIAFAVNSLFLWDYPTRAKTIRPFEMDIVLNIAPVFFVIFLGAGAKRLGFFPEAFIREANRLAFYVGVPALLFIKLSHAPFRETFDITLALISCLSVFLVWLFSLLLVTVRAPSNAGAAASFVQTSMHGNIGYIALAVVYYVMGDRGLGIAGFLAAFIILSQNTLSVLSFNIFSGTESSASASFLNIVRAICLNPIIISCFAGLSFSFFGLDLPPVFHRFLEILSSMALPLALLIIGASLSRSRMSRNLTWLIVSLAIKLLLLPGLGSLLLYHAGAETLSITVAAILLGAPTATVSVIMSGEMNGDITFASSQVTLSTLVSALTFCFWTYLIGTFGL